MRKTRSARKLRFRSSTRLPKRSEVVKCNTKKYKGGALVGGALVGGASGVVFPPSFSQSVVDANPQSFLPVNTFSNDPNYSVVDARLTSPFLTGVSSGGRRSRHKKAKMRKGPNQKGPNQKGGSSTAAQALSNIANSTIGQFPSAGMATNIGGVTNIAANLSGASSTYNSTPNIPTPLA